MQYPIDELSMVHPMTESMTGTIKYSSGGAIRRKNASEQTGGTRKKQEKQR
jgi:hypothetical protein